MIYTDFSQVEKDVLDWLFSYGEECENYDDAELAASGNADGSFSFCAQESAENYSQLIYDENFMNLMREIHENPERLYLYDPEGFEVLARICAFPAAWEAYQNSKED